MDEESPKKKISVNSFFERVDSVEKVASSALSKYDSVMNVANANKLLIESLQLTVETMQTEIRDIANYIIVENKLEKDLKEDRLLEEQDAQQKKDISEKLFGLKGSTGPAGPQGLKGEDFGSKEGGGSFLGGLLKGLATLGAGAFALKFMWPALLPVVKGALGSAVGGGIKFLGGAVGKTLIGILGGIPLIGAAAKLIGGGIERTSNKAADGLEKSIKNMGEDGKINIPTSAGNVGGEKIPKEIDKKVKGEKKSAIIEKGVVTGGNASQEESDLMKRQMDIEEEIFSLYDGNPPNYDKIAELEKESEEIDKKLFNLGNGDSVQPEKKKGRGILGMIGGGIDALTGNLTDLDKRGGKTFGSTRVATGMADFFTADMFDLDKRGKMDLFGMRKKMKNKKAKEAYENNPVVQQYRKKRSDLKEKASKIPMETTVNPDGSITSKGSGTLIGDELFTPGQPLTEKQKLRIDFGLQMGNTYSSEIMESYNMETIKKEKAIEPVMESKDVGSLEIPKVNQTNNSNDSAQNVATLPPSPIAENTTPLVQASPPQVSSAMIKPTEAPIPFRKLISSKKYLSVSDMPKSGLPPQIAKMIS